LSRGLHWFRNDLRLTDHASLDALFRAVDPVGGVVVSARRS